MKVSYSDLKKYLELQEKIKELTGELEEIKAQVKESFGNHGGEFELGGILVKYSEKSMTRTDMEALTQEVGFETVAKYQSESVYFALTVKATSKALKNKAAI